MECKQAGWSPRAYKQDGPHGPTTWMGSTIGMFNKVHVLKIHITLTLPRNGPLTIYDGMFYHTDGPMELPAIYVRW